MKTGSAPIVLLLLPDAFPSVRDLLFSRSPAAIFWRVVAVVVHAIKAEMLSRSSAHVREEIGEFAPALADANATAAVILETFHVGIAAPCMHRLPDAVFRCCFAMSGFAMRHSCRMFLLPTSAGFRMPAYDVVRLGFECATTLAAKPPDRELSWQMNSYDFECDDFPEALPGQIEAFHG
jgi:hypothetical protein